MQAARCLQVSKHVVVRVSETSPSLFSLLKHSNRLLGRESGSPSTANVPQALRRPILTPLVGSSRAAARAFATEVPPAPASTEKESAAPHADDVAAANSLTAHLPPNVSFIDLGSKPTAKQEVASRAGE